MVTYVWAEQDMKQIRHAAASGCASSFDCFDAQLSRKGSAGFRFAASQVQFGTKRLEHKFFQTCGAAINDVNEHQRNSPTCLVLRRRVGRARRWCILFMRFVRVGQVRGFNEGLSWGA